jgi:hypothetical protein
MATGKPNDPLGGGGWGQNDPKCYQGVNIMGPGARLEPINAMPWCHALVKHLDDGKTTRDDWLAKARLIFPGNRVPQPMRV